MSARQWVWVYAGLVAATDLYVALPGGTEWSGQMFFWIVVDVLVIRGLMRGSSGALIVAVSLLMISLGLAVATAVTDAYVTGGGGPLLGGFMVAQLVCLVGYRRASTEGLRNGLSAALLGLGLAAGFGLALGFTL